MQSLFVSVIVMWIMNILVNRLEGETTLLYDCGHLMPWRSEI